MIKTAGLIILSTVLIIKVVNGNSLIRVKSVDFYTVNAPKESSNEGTVMIKNWGSFGRKIQNGHGMAGTKFHGNSADLTRINHERKNRSSFHFWLPQKNSETSLVMTLAEGNYCAMKKFDTQDPRCARVVFNGNIVKIPENSEEWRASWKGMVNRHPEMQLWPKDHHFFMAKMVIERIMVLDYFGGFKEVPVEDYFNASLNVK